jgi:hypothetical protein
MEKSIISSAALDLLRHIKVVCSKIEDFEWSYCGEKFKTKVESLERH